jgi:hypothetical protein
MQRSELEHIIRVGGDVLELSIDRGEISCALNLRGYIRFSYLTCHDLS